MVILLKFSAPAGIVVVGSPGYLWQSLFRWNDRRAVRAASTTDAFADIARVLGLSG